ncbi:RVT_1 domain-containing protein/zf-CCHC domain-containing protein/RVP_2 domain-containing protein, partial [Cephalotus follicularis]
MNLVLIT